jgi:hypothetical protein
MKDDPSEPLCRRRLQTTRSCVGPNPAVVNSGKGVAMTAPGMDKRDERK